MPSALIPGRLPPWVLPQEETHALFQGGHGTSTVFIYAIAVLDKPDPNTTNFDKKLCTLILIEIEFSADLGCNKKHAEKTEKYYPSLRPSKSTGGG
jgi:hypothetical protein